MELRIWTSSECIANRKERSRKNCRAVIGGDTCVLLVSHAYCPIENLLSSKIEASTSLLDADLQEWAFANSPRPVNVCLVITRQFYSKSVPLETTTLQKVLP